MEKPLCRICLAENIRMHSILNTDLQYMYEKLTELPVATFEPDMQLLTCYICYAQLKSSHKLMMKCYQSHVILTKMMNGIQQDRDSINKQLSNFNSLTEMSVVTMNIPETSTIGIKYEILENMADDVKIEIEERRDYSPIPDGSPEHSFNSQSDPEDDLPLSKFQGDTDTEAYRTVSKRRRRIHGKEKRIRLKLDAREIRLSKQQQLDELTARSKSVNYTKSPYKCDLCYKGFVDAKAYNNHRIKHDERSGPYVCDICHMRYVTPQLMKTHIITSHARLYKCNKCDHTCHTMNQARVHERWHTGYTYECKLCGHKFRKPTSYLSHLRTRHPTEHVCNVCGTSFVGKHGLQMHKKKTHNNLEKIEVPEDLSECFCAECNIQFCTLEAWRRHILCSIKHTLKNENSTQCMICGWRSSPASVSLSEHMRGHSRALRCSTRQQAAEGDRVACTQCNANFSTSYKLRAHTNRVHLGLKYNKDVVCEVCGKHCTSNATLKYHQRTHTGEKPYSCSTCTKQFSDSNQLRIHTRTHTGEKPYVCNACGKRFSQKPALNRHYRVHTGAKPYMCTYCSRTFSQSNSLKLHIKTVHLKLPAAKKHKSIITKNCDNVEKIEQEIENV